MPAYPMAKTARNGEMTVRPTGRDDSPRSPVLGMTAGSRTAGRALALAAIFLIPVMAGAGQPGTGGSVAGRAPAVGYRPGDRLRPRPTVVVPPTAGTEDAPGRPPS